MAEIVRNSKENTFEIFQGFSNKRQKKNYRYTPLEKSGVDIVNDKYGKIVGVRFRDYFENVEIASYYAENEFRKVLEKAKIPSIYTGMFLEIGEEATGFYYDAGSRRPDFLVSIPDVGTVFVDVKVRKLLNGGDTSFFTLSREDIENLYFVQKSISLPVWVVLKDINEFDSVKKVYKNKKFYYTTARVLYAYIKRIDSIISRISKNSEFKRFYIYKIPVSLFEENENFEQITFMKKVSDEELEKMARYHLENVKEIRNSIIELVANNKVYKTQVVKILSGKEKLDGFDKICSGNVSFEINQVLKDMIDRKEIIHKDKSPIELPNKVKKGNGAK